VVREGRRELTRADLPAELTPETIRRLPLSVLRRLAEPGNGILGQDEQRAFDAALHEVMSGAARRVSRQLDRSDWATMLPDARTGGPRGGPGRHTRADQQLRRLARQIGQQVDVAESLAPGVDWSFAQPAEPSAPAQPESTESTESTQGTGGDDETVADLEDRLAEQVELVQVMSEIADVSKRTYELEQQRDLQSTRTVFFGFVVSVAVLVAGWAPIVAADDWDERFWILALTVITCLVAGAVYGLVRRWQISHQPDPDDDRQTQ
jgi:hypothetical protein